MKEITRNRKLDFEYSLHNSRITKITFADINLAFAVDQVFSYSDDGEEHGFEAEVIFTRCDIEDCWVLVYDEVLSEGKFSGQNITMKDFIKQYSNQEFEIITDLHNGYTTKFVGWLWKKEAAGATPVSAQIEIWNVGDMIIRIGKQVF